MAPVGRPTKYHNSIPEKMLNYFLEALEKPVEKGQAPDLPTIQEFAVVHLNVDPSTLRAWAKDEDKEDFSAVYKKCKAIQEAMLIKHGVTNRYAQAMSCFLLKNWAGMADKLEQKTEHSISEIDKLIKGVEGDS